MGPRPTGRNPRIREIQGEERSAVTTVQAVNRFQSKKRGPLTEQEKKRCRDNNLCMYCGKPGHIASECRAPPNKQPNPPPRNARQLETVPEDKPIPVQEANYASEVPLFEMNKEPGTGKSQSSF